MTNSYGEFIKRHRIASGFKSQRQLAEESGVSRTTISRAEKNDQKPNPDTLKDLSKHLKSTSYVELMVACDYWDDDELLEPIDTKNIYAKESPSRYGTEKEFVSNLELSDEELLKQYNLELDGKRLTKDEAKGVVAYLRSLREIGK